MKKKIRTTKAAKSVAVILLFLFLLVPMASVSYAVEQNTDDTTKENLYAMRIKYAQEVAAQDMYNLRMQYYSMMEEQDSIRYKIVDYALSFVGVTPYVPGSYSLWGGTDCSGFVFLIFGTFGYWLPTGSDAYQFYVGHPVSYEEILPGDIIVYDWGQHVGIYAGNDLVVHCSSPENGTVCWNMWYRNVTAIVRVID